jgi:hypothetical protein
MTDFVLGLPRRKILLTRNNLLAAYSSQKITELTRKNGTAGARAEVRPRVPFNPKEFAKFRATRKRTYADARGRINGTKLEIDYIAARTDEGTARVARFLGVDPQGFGTPRTIKRNTDEIVSRFENPDAVWSFLRRNALEHWAVED